MSEIELLKQVIETVKKRPNSLARNKVVSHCEDALAHAYRLPQDAPLPDAPAAGVCICPVGARDFACPVHGQ